MVHRNRVVYGVLGEIYKSYYETERVNVNKISGIRWFGHFYCQRDKYNRKGTFTRMFRMKAVGLQSDG